MLLADRDFLLPGVRLFRAADCAPIAGPIDFGLPPCDMAPLEAPTPTSAPPAAASTLRLHANWPDPFNPTTTLRVEAPPGTDLGLDILDVRGRRVRALWQGSLHSSGRDFVWDGRDDAGAPLPSGVYVARLHAAGATQSERLTLVR